MGKAKAGGIIQNINLARIGVMSVPDRPGIASIVLGALFDKNVNVQFISQAADLNSRSNIIICVNMSDLEISRLAIENIKTEINAEKIDYQANVAMVSIYGPHFKDQPGVAVIAFSALASVDVNIIAISTSISTISCVVDNDKIGKAVDVLMSAFSVPTSSIFIASNGLSLHSKGDNEK